MVTLLSTPRSVPGHTAERAHLRQRMQKPQRHRLLHGYPLAAAMPARAAGQDLDVEYRADTGRGLLVGVLPHPFCNPKVKGCGFCTFAHESYDGGRAARVVGRVTEEIKARTANRSDLRGRPVTALYFGGGTANLAPSGPFRELCRALAVTFDLRDAEVTLEGVPAYFVKRRPLLIDVMREELPARHFRISMGIQTFDESRLRQMGREAFGDVGTFTDAVDLAHERGFTASADLLFNLPGQGLHEMKRDVARADALGLDHVGLYHLVLFRGLGTAWSQDPEMLAGLPDNATAAENWLALRDRLLDAGFTQTTLTNFERSEFRGAGRRFRYEECSFRPDHFDMIGFGPGGISFAAAADYRRGLKVLNPDGADDYAAAVARDAASAWDRSFEYGPADMHVFHLTRRLAALEIGRGEFRRLFGADVRDAFPGEVEALIAEGLVESDVEALRPTARGMFYADSIASLFARRRRPTGARADNNGHGHM